MTSPVLTETQAQALECLEGARSAGLALSEHVRSRGLDLRRIYDAIAQLRRLDRFALAAMASHPCSTGSPRALSPRNRRPWPV